MNAPYHPRVEAGEPPKRHPFIQELFDTLLDAGADWPPEEQDDWIETAKGIFKLIYNKPRRQA
jgi:hypothetical protein